MKEGKLGFSQHLLYSILGLYVISFLPGSLSEGGGGLSLRRLMKDRKEKKDSEKGAESGRIIKDGNNMSKMIA